MEEMTPFSIWLRDMCERGVDVDCLEGGNGTGFYQTREWKCESPNRFWLIPTYHVWIDSTPVMSSEDYETAWKCYERISDEWW